MHLLETYALASGSKIDKPYIYTKYVPLPVDDFITMQVKGKNQARDFDYWQEVVDFISPSLEKLGLKIIQLGSKSEAPLVGVFPLLGQTDLSQYAYVISKAKLHLGIDSSGVHIASHFDRPIVALFGNSSPEVSGPYFGDKNKQICIHPFSEDRLPSYAPAEQPKTINLIKPEEVAKAVLKLLGTKHEEDLKTRSRGPRYNHPNVQMVPDSVTTFKGTEVDNMIIRMDLEFNEDVLVNQLAKGRCSVISRKPITADILKKFKMNISEFVYLLDKEHNPPFVEELKANGINFMLLAEMTEEEVEAVKLYYMNYGLVQQRKYPNPKDVERLKKIGTKNLYYRSKKFLVSKGKIFPSIAAWEEDMPIEEARTQTLPVIDKESFWQELEDYYILEK